MNCPRCVNIKLRVVRTYTAQATGSTAERECPACKSRYATVTMILDSGSAYLAHRKLANGQLAVVEKPD